MGKDELSKDQVSSMKEAFMLFDTNGDGKIAHTELGILMRSLGGNPTEAQLKSIIATENLSSPFDFNRFLDLMAKHLKTEPFDRQLRDAFKVLDKEGTGFVAVADLRHILTSIGEKLEPSEFDEWIKEVDVGSDGKIRYEDFIARMVAKSKVTWKNCFHGGSYRSPPSSPPSAGDHYLVKCILHPNFVLQVACGYFRSCLGGSNDSFWYIEEEGLLVSASVGYLEEEKLI